MMADSEAPKSRRPINWGASSWGQPKQAPGETGPDQDSGSETDTLGDLFSDLPDDSRQDASGGGRLPVAQSASAERGELPWRGAPAGSSSAQDSLGDLFEAENSSSLPVTGQPDPEHGHSSTTLPVTRGAKGSEIEHRDGSDPPDLLPAPQSGNAAPSLATWSQTAVTQPSAAQPLVVKPSGAHGKSIVPPSEALRRLSPDEVATARRRARATGEQARLHRSEELWDTASSLLILVSGDPELQTLASSFRLTRDPQLDVKQRRDLENSLSAKMLASGINIPNPADKDAIFDMVYDELLGISVLGPYWRDDSITDVFVNAWDEIWVGQGSTTERAHARFRNMEHEETVARGLAAKVSDRGLTPDNPLVSAQLPGARIFFAGRPIVRDGVSVSLRKQMPLPSPEKLLEFGAFDSDMLDFLAICVQARASILVSGATGAGKTTLINAISRYIPPTERVITIEDVFELTLTNQHVLPLQTKERASADDEVVVEMSSLLNSTLRMRPDRIIVGEIRDGAGAVVMLRAASTGHEGTMTTVHANSAEDALNERMVDLVLEGSDRPPDVARRTVARAFNLVVQVTRRRGRQFVSEISVVDPSCIRDNWIYPDPIFAGELSPDGEPQFRRTGEVRPDTELGRKMLEYREEDGE